ncbi:MAG: serpin family protein [Bacteroidales bacterium]|nr:serpin family protein [Bacteroidales bacterium]
MKKTLLFVAAIALVCACVDPADPVVPVDEQIKVSSPEPSTQLTKVDLSTTEQGYVDAGNKMAFKFLGQMYEGKNMVLSPLSLQYVLAMSANGASGQTRQEIIDFLGYGKEGVAALNAYSKKLLEQLPAVDLGVTLKLTDALLVKKELPLLPDFKSTVEKNYYAAVENMDFSDPAKVAARVNEWASRSTNGFIDKVLQASDISPVTVALLMNALYFKAKWAGSEYDPMFLEDATSEDTFKLGDGTSKKMPFMNNMRHHQYAEKDGYKVLALPYAGGKFFMYILLPDENKFDALLEKLPGISWRALTSDFKTDADVYLKLPKFDIENTYDLTKSLQAMGVKKAFKEGQAEFDSMFDPKYTADMYFWISKVMQKAKISVAEWGTEAAAVTVALYAGNAGPGPEPKRINFYCDHPFVFVIGEATSGTILFEGVFSGRSELKPE